jgi:hypothetical protein
MFPTPNPFTVTIELAALMAAALATGERPPPPADSPSSSPR